LYCDGCLSWIIYYTQMWKGYFSLWQLNTLMHMEYYMARYNKNSKGFFTLAENETPTKSKNSNVQTIYTLLKSAIPLSMFKLQEIHIENRHLVRTVKLNLVNIWKKVNFWDIILRVYKSNWICLYIVRCVSDRLMGVVVKQGARPLIQWELQ
jgi:hypothetical protein